MSQLEFSAKELLIGARKGIPKSMLLSIAHDCGLTLKQLSTYLGISTRTIQKKDLSQSIVPNPSERALYIANLFKQGIEQFGSQDRFQNWLNSENPAMGNEKPAS